MLWSKDQAGTFAAAIRGGGIGAPRGGVAGYSDYFCDLGRSLQDEIIAHTEHQSF